MQVLAVITKVYFPSPAPETKDRNLKKRLTKQIEGLAAGALMNICESIALKAVYNSLSFYLDTVEFNFRRAAKHLQPYGSVSCEICGRMKFHIQLSAMMVSSYYTIFLVLCHKKLWYFEPHSMYTIY